LKEIIKQNKSMCNHNPILIPTMEDILEIKPAKVGKDFTTKKKSHAFSGISINGEYIPIRVLC
jgi:hypothetical protein